jgi:hypothetical protein
MSRIRGRIIRIVDNTTVIINLGREDGVQSRSLFSILGMPEPIIDPESSETLGHVSVVKGKVRASEVFDKFTIATSKWTTYSSGSFLRIPSLFPDMPTPQLTEHGRELLVSRSELQPWKAETEDPVSVGDEVEVEIDEEEEEEERPEESEGQIGVETSDAHTQEDQQGAADNSEPGP